MVDSLPPMLRALPGRALDDDRPIREAFHRGDARALEPLVAPHLDGLYTLCLRLLGSSADANDVAQDTLVKALERSRRYDPSRPFRPWLFKVAVNLCRDRLRTVWWRRVLALDAAPVSDPSPGPEELSAAGRRDRLVREALAKLPPIYREALALYHLEDLQYTEISEITGVAVPALKQRVRRGSMMLRDAVAALYPELVPTRSGGE